MALELQPQSNAEPKNPRGNRKKRAVLILLASVLAVGCVVMAVFFAGNKTPAHASTSVSGNSVTDDRFLSNSKFQGYNCVDDRWNHLTKMYANTWLCSTSNSYVWGMSARGNLVWKNLDTGKKKVLFSNDKNAKSNYFWLTLNGTFTMIGDNNETLWSKLPGSYTNIGYHQCLAKYACPYLHLHGDGVIVLNWIDASTGQWVVKNAMKLYDF